MREVIGVRIEMSSSYAVCCMLHAVCCMLYAVPYAVCCMLHAILKAFGDARILPIFIKNPIVVFGGLWKRLEVLGTLLELPSKMGGSGGAEPPQVSQGTRVGEP